MGTALLFSVWSLGGLAQDGGNGKNLENTLLWKISGNGLAKPSYLFGTIHMLCSSDAALSERMQQVIRDAEEVYFEVDLDNVGEMLMVMSKMKMNGDTTLRDLLPDTDYLLIKEYFENKKSLVPFSLLETYKPILALSTLQENSLACESMAMMEQVIMKKAKESRKRIRGLETMAYQAGVLDSIPYKLQAEQLLNYVRNINNSEDKELEEMMQAYRDQDLNRLEQLMKKTDMGIGNFTEVLLYRRNRNWVDTLKTLLPGNSLLIAVGAGHLPGDQGMIQLLRKEGYVVTAVENKIGK